MEEATAVAAAGAAATAVVDRAEAEKVAAETEAAVAEAREAATVAEAGAATAAGAWVEVREEEATEGGGEVGEACEESHWNEHVVRASRFVVPPQLPPVEALLSAKQM